jgi:hypothetical protein
MRIFWIIILVLAVLTVFIVWRGGDSGPAPALQAVTANPLPERLPSRDADVTSENGSRATPQAASAPTREITDAEIEAMFSPPAAISNETATGDSEADALVEDLIESSQAGANDDDVRRTLNEGSAAVSGEGAAAPPGQIDGKYILAGDGSAEHPFEITWDLLVLTSQTFQPRLNKSEIPPQISALNGKRIKLTGYFAFPLASMDAREVLFMLNMWDGCCIGVPPSPHDAIEVRLKEPMPNARKQFTNYGTLTGTLKVDPYVQDGWLLGMYLMEDGAIEPAM